MVEPVHQFHVVGDPAEAGHGRVGVGVDEPGHDDRARDIDRLPALKYRENLFIPSHGNNRIAVDSEGAREKFRVLFIHCNNSSAGNQDINSSCHLASRYLFM